MKNFRSEEKIGVRDFKGKMGICCFRYFCFFLVYMVVLLPFDIILSGGPSVWFNQEEITVTADIVNTLISILLIPFSVGIPSVFSFNTPTRNSKAIRAVYDLCGIRKPR